MRHAEAEDFAREDAQRRLTPRGIEQARAMGQWLAAQGAVIDMLCSSPYLRATQTSTELGRCFGLPLPRELAELTPSGNLKRLLRLWDRTDLPGGELPRAAIWVTHQPLVGELRNYLVEGSVGHGFPFAPATIALLEYQHLGPGSASEIWRQDVLDPGQVS